MIRAWNNRHSDSNKFIPQLKHCPFCGSNGVYLNQIRGKYIVQCANFYDDCGITTKEYDTEEEAITAWNMRDDVQ